MKSKQRVFLYSVVSILLLFFVFILSANSTEKLTFTSPPVKNIVVTKTSLDTTKKSELVFGNNIELKNDISNNLSLEVTAISSIDLKDNFNTVSGDYFDASIGNVVSKIQTYAVPTYGEGVVRLNYKGEVVETILNLRLSLDNSGNTILQDLAYKSNLHKDDTKNFTKKYLIGYADKYNSENNAFSVEDLKNGINVNAYKGREVTITAYMQNNGEKWEANNTFQQTIFIPDPNYKHTRSEGNITYFYAPPTRIYKESLVHYFDEYIPKINISEGDIIGVLATTKQEHENPSWQGLNIYSASTKDKKKSIFYIGDDFVKKIPSNGVRHPNAYEVNSRGSLNIQQWELWYDAALADAGNIENFRARTIEAFKSEITRPFGFKYKVVFVNNELVGFWERTGAKGTSFRSWVRDAYTEHYKETGNYIMAWNENIYNYDKIISDVGYGDSEDIINGTFNDLNFDSNYNFDNFINWQGKFATIQHSSMLGWGTPMVDGGGYSNNFFNYELTYNYIYTGLFTEKHNTPKKVINVHWHDLEPTYGQFIQTDRWFKFKNKIYRVPAKQIVGPESMFALGAATAFFMPPGKGGYISWSDPLIWSSKDEADKIYPYTGLNELTKNGDVPIRNDVGSFNFPVNTTTYLNQVIDAYYIVKEHKEILENSKVFIADVFENNEWFTDKEKYPYAAAFYKRPFVAYRKYNNELLVFAYAWYNHNITTTKFRTEDGKEFEIELKGCYPTIAKIKL